MSKIKLHTSFEKLVTLEAKKRRFVYETNGVASFEDCVAIAESAYRAVVDSVARNATSEDCLKMIKLRVEQTKEAASRPASRENMLLASCLSQDAFTYASQALASVDRKSARLLRDTLAHLAYGQK